MHDIIVETAAAFVVNLYIYTYLKTGSQNWVSRLMTDFVEQNKA
jgi:hypothetical protein